MQDSESKTCASSKHQTGLQHRHRSTTPRLAPQHYNDVDLYHVKWCNTCALSPAVVEAAPQWPGA